MNDPLISVIIPTYNRAGLIEPCINSVLKQTYKNVEVIIVDDCSSDNTEEVVKNINDPRLRLIKHCSNLGASAARNTGIKESAGEFINLLDSDDRIYPSKLEQQIRLFNDISDEYGLVYCGFNYTGVNNNDKILRSVTPKYRGYVFKNLLGENILGSPTPLIRSECFEKCGYFDEELPACQDWDMWIRISRSFKFDFIDKYLASVTVHGDQISTNLQKKIKGREFIIKKYLEHFSRNNLSSHYRRLGSNYCLFGQKDKGNKYYIKSIRSNFTNFGSYMNLLMSLISSDLHKFILRKISVKETGGTILYP